MKETLEISKVLFFPFKRTSKFSFEKKMIWPPQSNIEVSLIIEKPFLTKEQKAQNTS